MGFKKKLHQFNPDETIPVQIQSTKRRCKTIRVSSASNERYVREILAGKLSGTHLGLWLLVPEYLRLGVWDLLQGTFGRAPSDWLASRIALQMVGESALCVNRLRRKGSLCNQGFSLAAGLSFLASDPSVHRLLEAQSIARYEDLQATLLQLRRLGGHYHEESILAIDPHRIESATQRQMPARKKRPARPSAKMLQTFFCLDTATGQPLGFTIASSGASCTKATLRLLELLEQGGMTNALLLADKEHFTKTLAHHFAAHPHLDILLPVPMSQKVSRYVQQLVWKSHWAGYALSEGTYRFAGSDTEFRLLGQRQGERRDGYSYKAFLTTSGKPVCQLLSQIFPKRWSIEEFYNFEGDMGWNRASTFNLHIRYGKQSLALIAQAATHQLKNRLPAPYRQWTARHLAEQVLTNMEGDIRVKDDTIIVTYYRDHQPLGLASHYQNLPQILQAEGVNPKIPWLCDFKLDFRFK